MTSETTITIGIPVLLNFLTFAVLWGKMQQKQDDQANAIKEAHEDSEHVDKRLSQVERQTAVITTELVGISGNNGLKSEIRALHLKVDRLIDLMLHQNTAS